MVAGKSSARAGLTQFRGSRLIGPHHPVKYQSGAVGKIVRLYVRKDPVKLVATALAAAYFVWCAYDPHRWHFIDGVDLIIHEAGHVVFMPFGEFITVAGGSLFQLIMPAAFALYFYRRGQPFSAALVLFWLGQSLLNVAVYAGDALRLELPLLGGQDSVHDWNYMLDRLGLLASSEVIGGGLRVCGTVLIVAAGLCAFSRSGEDEGT